MQNSQESHEVSQTKKTERALPISQSSMQSIFQLSSKAIHKTKRI
jgi:hypothetical protein